MIAWQDSPYYSDCMFLSLFLIWQDFLYYTRRGVIYLLFFLPGYVRFFLSRGKIFELTHSPLCLIRENKTISDELMRDIYSFQGESIEWVRENPSENLWEPIATSHIFAEAMHRFVWLPHLANHSEKARTKMLRLIAHWVENNAYWSQPAWRSDIVAERLYYMMSFYKQISKKMSKNSITHLNTQLHQHYRHLKLTAHWETRGAKKLISQIILLISMICKSETSIIIEKHMYRLVQELNHQISPDGGHCERNPETHFVILRWLCLLYELFLRDQRQMPEEISGTIDRMIPYLRMMQRQDGELFIFNGGGIRSAKEIDDMLPLAARGRMPGALKSAPYSGFETISNEFVQVAMDVGNFPFSHHAYDAHAEALAIEVMMGDKPIIVNCGTLYHFADPYWTSAQRGSMAHSTIILDNYNTSSLRRYSLRRAKCQSQRKEEDGHLLLQASHNGYMRPCHTHVERSLYLAKKDKKLVGEDKLLADEGHSFHIRFHLHHRVIVELQDDKVFLRVDNTFLCQFLYEGADLRVEDSIYSPNHDRLYQNKQLVLYGQNYSQNTVIRWSIKHVTDLSK